MTRGVSRLCLMLLILTSIAACSSPDTSPPPSSSPAPSGEPSLPPSPPPSGEPAPSGEPSSAPSPSVTVVPPESPVASPSSEPSPSSPPSTTLQPKDGKITFTTLPNGQQVMLLNLTVSLEWNPNALLDEMLRDCAISSAETSGSNYVSDLELAFQRAAAYLYYYTEGQVSLGGVEVYSDREHWNDADVRILANGAYRPTAFVGGLVEKPTQYTSPVSGTVPVVFYPGPILLSRFWNGGSARCGRWSEAAGWRTLGHELAHYAFYLYDEYMDQVTSQEKYCTTTDLAPSPGALSKTTMTSLTDSLMAYHYTADKLWLAQREPPPVSCSQQAQHLVHKMSDWATIASIYEPYGIHAPSALVDTLRYEATPLSSTFAFTDSTVRAPSTLLSVDLPPLSMTNVTTPTEVVGSAYLIRPAPQANEGDDYLPQRVLAQGNVRSAPEGVALPFIDVQENDRVVAIFQNPVKGEPCRYSALYTQAGTASQPLTLQQQRNDWCPHLVIRPVVTDVGGGERINAIHFEVEDLHWKTSRIKLGFCPVNQDCSQFRDIGLPTEDRGYKARVDFDITGEQQSIYGYVFARGYDENGNVIGETASWYQMSGGVGPASIDGHPPLADGLVSVNLDVQNAGNLQKIPPGTRVFYYPAQICPDNERKWQIIGTPFSVQIAALNQGTLSQPIPLIVRLGYDQELLDQLGVAASQLTVLRLKPQEWEWQEVNVIGRSEALAWIAAEEPGFAREGVVYAIGIAP